MGGRGRPASVDTTAGSGNVIAPPISATDALHHHHHEISSSSNITLMFASMAAAATSNATAAEWTFQR